METNKEPTPGSSTPWGEAQGVEKIGRGIVFVDTAGHGGIWLSDERMQEMPEPLRKIGEESKFHPEFPTWFEEDAEISAVVAAFPDKFSLNEVGSAMVMLRTVYPKEWKALNPDEEENQ